MAENWQPASVIAQLYGSDVRRIQQLNTAGVIKSDGRRPAKYDLLPTIMALFRYQREIIQGKAKNDAMEKLEEQKLQAEVDIKQAKAEAAQLELAELQGKLHRAEDVEAITTDHVLFLRSMLIGMPGKLAVDLGGTHTPAEQAERVNKEVHFILEELTNYKYDPAEYKKRVMERQGWDHRPGDDGDG